MSALYRITFFYLRDSFSRLRAIQPAFTFGLILGLFFIFSLIPSPAFAHNYLYDRNTKGVIEDPSLNLTPDRDKEGAPICTYLASYAPGYDWQDRETKALKEGLNGACQLHTFYMNSKQIKNQSEMKHVAQLAYKFIKQYQPKALIASDDNAMKYVVQPYFKNSDLPVIFLGINNTGKPYGLPYQNTAGMLEKLPFDKMIHFMVEAIPSHKKHIHVAYLTAPSTSEQKNINTFQERASSHPKIQITIEQVRTISEWRQRYIQLQQDEAIDFIILGNLSSLPEYSNKKLMRIFSPPQNDKKLVLSFIKTMYPFSHILFEKSPEEQGRWGALTAVALLKKGYTIQELPIVPNRFFPVSLNEKRIQQLPQNLQKVLNETFIRLSGRASNE